MWGLNSTQTKEMLDAALGIRAVVRKQRELWRKDNVTFNLDTVETVGQILEVEILSPNPPMGGVKARQVGMREPTSLGSMGTDVTRQRVFSLESGLGTLGIA